MVSAANIVSVEDTITPPAAFAGRLPSLVDYRMQRPNLLQRLGYLIMNPYKNVLLPTAWLLALIKTSRSPLITESMIRPGGWRSMELIYRNDAPVDWLDRQALRDNPISMAARNRRKIVTNRLTELIRAHSSAGQLTLMGIGSGPGWHLQTAMAESGITKSQMTAHLIDQDDDAFAYGRALAANFGLESAVQFHRADARQIQQTLPGEKVQIAELVGIVEYLTDQQFMELLTALRNVMVAGGSLVTHGLVDRYHTGAFLARVFQLRHHQRDAEEMTRILNRSGFRVVECQYDATGIHPILTAVRTERLS